MNWGEAAVFFGVNRYYCCILVLCLFVLWLSREYPFFSMNCKVDCLEFMFEILSLSVFYFLSVFAGLRAIHEKQRLLNS